MANAFISEYFRIKDRDSPCASEPPLATQTVTYSTATQSETFGDGVRFIRIVCDAKAHFEFGPNPAATANSPYLAADIPEYFGVSSNHKVSFYDGSS